MRRTAGALRLGRRAFGPGQFLIMAVADGTPRDGAAALERVHAVVAEGADIIAVPAPPGGGAPQETAAFIAAVRDAYPDLVIGVDTGRHEVAREACAAGADLLSDCRGGWEAGMVEVAAEFGAGLAGPLDLAARAVAAGVDQARIIIDVGGHTWPSPQITGRLEELVAMGWPVLVSPPDQDVAGASRDGTVDERLAGALAGTAVCAWLGARVFRVRQVRQARRVLSMVSAIRGDIPPAAAVRGLA